jgi:hypothetical protein
MVEGKYVYFTSDGSWFLDRGEAEKHEEIEDFTAFLNKSGFLYTNEIAGNLLHALQERYTMYEKDSYKLTVKSEESE